MNGPNMLGDKLEQVRLGDRDASQACGKSCFGTSASWSPVACGGGLNILVPVSWGRAHLEQTEAIT